MPPQQKQKSKKQKPKSRAMPSPTYPSFDQKNIFGTKWCYVRTWMAIYVREAGYGATHA
ncbi:hypothetical protein PSAB6_600006 [Paraburkholderia sabiae]|nr:hypothetical protein PSAB6_600006 [Paraburkholderia sabiae]